MTNYLIVDGNSLAFTSKPKIDKLPKEKVFSKTDGRDIYVQAKFIKKLMNYMFYEYINHRVLIVFDEKVKNTFRHKLDPEYKNRPLKPEQKENKDYVYSAVEELKKTLDQLGLTYYSSEEWEADDIIGMLAKKIESIPNTSSTIITSDADILQLISDKTKVLLQRGNDEELVDFRNINKYLPCNTPKEVIEVKALWGDKSDNIKHFMIDEAVYWGAKQYSLNLLRKYKSIDGIYENINSVKQPMRTSLLNNRDKIDHNLKLVTIVRDWSIDVDFKYFLKYSMTPKKLVNTLDDLNLNDLFKKRWFKFGFNRKFKHKPLGDEILNWVK